jgi:hypothetical protein
VCAINNIDMLRCRFQTAAVSVQCSPGSQTSTGDQHSRKRAAEQPALYEQQQRAAAAYQQQALQALQQQQGYQASLGGADPAAETLHTQMLLAVRACCVHCGGIRFVPDA